MIGWKKKRDKQTMGGIDEKWVLANPLDSGTKKSKLKTPSFKPIYPRGGREFEPPPFNFNTIKAMIIRHDHNLCSM